MFLFSHLRSVVRPVSTSAEARRGRAAIQRILPLLVLLLGIVGMPTLLLAYGGVARLQRLQSEEKSVKLEISRLSKRIVQLRAASDALKHDPTAVERSARDELGLVRRTEIVFHFEPTNSR
jgi:cell division protein FtsB